MKTVKPISAYSTEHTVTFAFSAFFVTLCVVSLAGMPKPGVVASTIRNSNHISKQDVAGKVIPAITNITKAKTNDKIN